MGVVVRRYIDFLILLIPIPCICFFAAERRRMPNRDFFYFAWYVHKLRYYSDVIHSFDWKSAIEHDGGV